MCGVEMGFVLFWEGLAFLGGVFTSSAPPLYFHGTYEVTQTIQR